MKSDVIYLKNKLHKNKELELKMGNNVIYGADLCFDLIVKVDENLLDKRVLQIFINSDFSCQIESLIKKVSILASKVEQGGLILEEVVSFNNTYYCEYMFNETFSFKFSSLDNFELYFEKVSQQNIVSSKSDNIKKEEKQAEIKESNLLPNKNIELKPLTNILKSKNSNLEIHDDEYDIKENYIERTSEYTTYNNHKKRVKSKNNDEYDLENNCDSKDKKLSNITDEKKDEEVSTNLESENNNNFLPANRQKANLNSKKKRISKSNLTEQKKSEEKLNECIICLDDFKKDSKKKATLDPCQHIFCFDCISKWSKKVNECPLCKREFNHIITWNVGKEDKLIVVKKKYNPSDDEEDDYEESDFNDSIDEDYYDDIDELDEVYINLFFRMNHGLENRNLIAPANLLIRRFLNNQRR